MKSSFFFLAIILLIFPNMALSETIVTVYADDNCPPYSYAGGDKALGIYNDILRIAFSRMDGYKVLIDPVPWKRGLLYIENGTGFALIPPYYWPKKRPFMHPYSVPILDEEVVAFCRPETLKTKRERWPDDYYGLTVGRNRGFLIGGQSLTDAVKEGKIMLEEANGTRENILKLLEGRIDVYIHDRMATLAEFNKIREEMDKYEGSKLAEGAFVSREQGYLGFTAMDNGKFAFKDDFVKKFNAAITEMKAKGEIKAILDKFLESGK